MNVDELTKNASNKGFERGSLETINLALGWLQASGLHGIARAMLADWEAGTMVGSVAHAPMPQPIAPTDLGPVAPKFVNRSTAAFMGFTGNCCSTCGSYQMVRNGTCEKCNECGSTTGCS